MVLFFVVLQSFTAVSKKKIEEILAEGFGANLISCDFINEPITIIGKRDVTRSKKRVFRSPKLFCKKIN